MLRLVSGGRNALEVDSLIICDLLDWHVLIFDMCLQKIDLAESYYVGDAAGRVDGWKVGAIKDFNNTDRYVFSCYAFEDIFRAHCVPLMDVLLMRIKLLASLLTR